MTSGYYCSRHVLVKSWTVRTYEGGQGPTSPGPRCLADSSPLLTCCSPPQRVLLRQPWFSCCFSYIHGHSQLKAFTCCCLCLESSSRLSPHFHQVCAQMSPPLAPPQLYSPYSFPSLFFLIASSNVVLNLRLLFIVSPPECKLHEGRGFCGCCLLLYLQHLRWYLAHSRHSWQNKDSHQFFDLLPAEKCGAYVLPTAIIWPMQ